MTEEEQAAVDAFYEKAFKGLAEHLDRMRFVILSRMNGSTHHGEPGYCTIAFCCGDRIPREIGRALIRDSRNRGLCLYGNGLFTEDGEVFGAGYAITEEGRKWLAERSKEKNDADDDTGGGAEPDGA